MFVFVLVKPTSVRILLVVVEQNETINKITSLMQEQLLPRCQTLICWAGGDEHYSRWSSKNNNLEIVTICVTLSESLHNQQTSSQHWFLSLISVSKTICHCYWYQHTPPSREDRAPRLLQLGWQMPSSNSKTVLTKLNGNYSSTLMQGSIPRQV